MPYRIPSHVTRNNGCARKRSEAKYRNLWPDFAWSPCLGNTGVNLREHIRQADGVLTDMVPVDDWVLSEGRWALDIDATNDIIVVTHTAALNIIGDMTIIGWIKTTNGSPTGGSILSKYNGDLNTVPYMTYLSAGVPTILFGEGASFAIVQAGASIADGTWRHFSATMAGSLLTLYMEAKSRGTDTFSGTRQTNSANLNLGYSGLAFRDVMIDDIRIYNRALSVNELQLDYSLGRGGWAEKRKRRVGVAQATASVNRDLLLLGVGA